MWIKAKDLVDYLLESLTGNLLAFPSWQEQ